MAFGGFKGSLSAVLGATLASFSKHRLPLPHVVAAQTARDVGSVGPVAIGTDVTSERTSLILLLWVPRRVLSVQSSHDCRVYALKIIPDPPGSR